MDEVTSFLGGGMSDAFFGADDQSDAIKQAAQTQKEGTAYAADIQKQMFDKQTQMFDPFLQSGYQANTQLADLLRNSGSSAQLPTDTPTLANLPDYASMVPDAALPNYDEMVTNADLTNDPVYQYRMQTGTRDLNRALASRNLQGGGQAVTAMTDLGQKVGGEVANDAYARNQSRYAAALQQALTKYSQNQNSYNASLDDAMNRYKSNIGAYGMNTERANTQYGRLTDLLKAGQGAAGQIGNASQNYGSNAANIAMTGANNQANAALAQGQLASEYSLFGKLSKLGGLASSVSGAYGG